MYPGSSHSARNLHWYIRFHFQDPTTDTAHSWPVPTSSSAAPDKELLPSESVSWISQADLQQLCIPRRIRCSTPECFHKKAACTIHSVRHPNMMFLSDSTDINLQAGNRCHFLFLFPASRHKLRHCPDNL